MSANPEHCRECNGKFGSGPICQLCEAVARFGLFVRSPRCPREAGRVALDHLREAHRAVLEAAEDFWIRHPEDSVGVGGLKGKAASLGVPPSASGGTPGLSSQREVREDRPPPPTEESAEKREDFEPHRREEEGEKHHRRRKHHSHREGRSRSRRQKKEKRRSRSATPRPVKAEVRSPRSSPREKKRREVSPVAAPVEPLPPAGPEEEDFLEEEESEEEEVPRSPLDPVVEPSQPARRQNRLCPRTPSRSPGRRRWTGPIPAGHRRHTSEASRPPPRRPVSPAPASKKKKKKKNKGKGKRERQKEWLRQHRDRGYRR